MSLKLTSKDKNFILISSSYTLSGFFIIKSDENLIILSSIIGFVIVAIIFSVHSIKLALAKAKNVDSNKSTNGIEDKKEVSDNFNKTGQSLYLILNLLSCSIVLVLSIFVYFLFPSFPDEMKFILSIVYVAINYLNVIFVLFWNFGLADKLLRNFTN